MALWVDKHRPWQLSELSYHKAQADTLRKMVASGDLPHLLFSGPSGAGKKTRVNAVLRELYGNGVKRLKMEHKTFTTPSNKKLEIATLASNYHIEMNPSDVGVQDRVVVQEVIKGMASTAQLDPASQKSFKVVVLREVDSLSREAQAALRRTMEKYSGTCRLILIAQSTSRVIAPLRSRCFHVRVPAPTQAEVEAMLTSVAKAEVGAGRVPAELIARIAAQAQGNARRAVLTLEACRVQNPHMEPNQPIPTPEWETYLRETGALLVKEQSPTALLKVRERLYELLGHCIPPERIFQGLVRELSASTDAVLRPRIAAAAAEFEIHQLIREWARKACVGLKASLRLGSKQIFHLEAFAARVMALIRAQQEGACLDDL